MCPSNPCLSIEPILAVPGMRALLRASGAPVIAVSRLVGADAVKGPPPRSCASSASHSGPAAITHHYAGSHRRPPVIDRRDAAAAGEIDCHMSVTDTLMPSLADRESLAREVLAFAAALGGTAGEHLGAGPSRRRGQRQAAPRLRRLEDARGARLVRRMLDDVLASPRRLRRDQRAR